MSRELKLIVARPVPTENWPFLAASGTTCAPHKTVAERARKRRRNRRVASNKVWGSWPGSKAQAESIRRRVRCFAAAAFRQAVSSAEAFAYVGNGAPLVTRPETSSLN